jgi:undecaprenyl-diphosphatase
VAVALDAWIEERVARGRGGGLDAPAHLLSAMGDWSKIWVAVAALRLATDRRTGRRAAVRALTAVAAQSALVNLGMKRVAARTRPRVDTSLRFTARRPRSSAFPSGHSASAACAAVLLSDRWRFAPIPLAMLALAIGWSRVQTGLHHASDVAAGLLIGAAVGGTVRRVAPLRSGT